MSRLNEMRCGESTANKTTGSTAPTDETIGPTRDAGSCCSAADSAVTEPVPLTATAPVQAIASSGLCTHVRAIWLPEIATSVSPAAAALTGGAA